MTRERVATLLSIGVLACVALACTCNVGGPQAHVTCNGMGDHFECALAHQGGGDGQVCFDIKLTCANGTVTTAHQCAQVTTGQTTNLSVPLTQFANHSACDSVSTTEIVNQGTGP